MTEAIPREVLEKVETIKDQLRAAKTIEAVNTTVKHVAEAVTALQLIDPVGVIDIKNLAAYRRMSIEKGWG